jgi:AcrR family transcriptional regulator
MHVRGRPKNAQPEETARTILEAATVLFAENGYNGASIRAIAEGAGVSVGTVQHHFGTKSELYDACIAKMYEELYTIVDDLGTIGDLPIQQLLEEAVRVGLSFARRHQMAIRLVTRTLMERGQIEENAANDFAVPLLDFAATLFADRAGGNPRDYFLPLQSGVFLVVRYALVNDAEAKRLVNVATDDPWPIIEAHLVDVMPKAILG